MVPRGAHIRPQPRCAECRSSRAATLPDCAGHGFSLTNLRRLHVFAHAEALSIHNCGAKPPPGSPNQMLPCLAPPRSMVNPQPDAVTLRKQFDLIHAYLPGLADDEDWLPGKGGSGRRLELGSTRRDFGSRSPMSTRRCRRRRRLGLTAPPPSDLHP